MRITRDTPDQLIVEHRAWRAPLFWATIAFVMLWIAAFFIGENAGILRRVAIGAGALIPGAIALLKAERSMLTLDRRNHSADLRHRTLSGLHRQTFRLDNVQGTRIASERRHKGRPAHKDPTRKLALFVKAGMDEGRHPLSCGHVPAKEALEVSRRVNTWMRALRRQEPLFPDRPILDSRAPEA